MTTDATSPHAEAQAVLQTVQELRLAARFSEAVEQLVKLGRNNLGDPDLVGQCFTLLHRCKGWSEAVSLYEDASKTKAIRKTRIHSVLLADCLSNLGRARAARVAIAGIAPGSLHETYDKIVVRVLQTEVEQVDPKVLEIEGAFAAGQVLKGSTLFRAYLERHRSQAVIDGGVGVRERERQAFMATFEAEFGVPAADRCLMAISDSIALPRPAIGVEVPQTYLWRLELALREALGGRLSVQPDCQRGRTIEGALQSVRAAERCKGFVIQVGIVDCAPRVFSEFDIEVVRQIRGDATANAMIDLARAHRDHLQGGRKSVYVPIERFRTLLAETLATAASKSDFIAIATIVTPSRRGSKMRDTLLAKNIETYNDALRAACAQSNAILVDLDAHIWSKADADKCFTSDNYHYNSLGHAYCAEALAAAMSQVLS